MGHASVITKSNQLTNLSKNELVFFVADLEISYILLIGAVILSLHHSPSQSSSLNLLL